MDIDRWKAMTFARPEFIPVSLGVLPAAWMKYREKLDEVAKRHPLLFGEVKPGRDYDGVWNALYRAGKHVDGWGCVWDNVYHGHDAYVVHHPLPRRQDVRALKPPTTDEGLPHGLMFMRLMYLRGFEELMVDFAEEPPELRRLIDAVLEYNLGQLDKHLATLSEPTMIGFGDDMGMQTALPISPAKWRTYLKPCFAELFGRCRRAGHTVYLHSDGHIWEIIPDLIECGVNVINPQYRANGIENLARVCKGKVCVDLDLDRQLLPFATAEQIDAHVREAVEVLGLPEGGLWLKAETDDGLTLETIEALCCALEKYRAHFRKEVAAR